MSKPRRKIIIDDDERELLEEQSLRERMDNAEKERIKRQEERQRRKKDRRSRVEKIMDRPLPISREEQFRNYKKEVFEELEKREKILENKMKMIEDKLTSNNDQKNKELEDNLVNNFIKKITLENYTKIDDKLKLLTTSLSEKIENLSKNKNTEEIEENKTIKSMMVGMQNKLKDMEKDLKNKKDIEEDEGTDSEGEQYDLLQKQINNITLLLAKNEKTNTELDIVDLETKIGKIVNENVDKMYTKLDKKIEMKMSQDDRMSDIMGKIVELENVSMQIKNETKEEVEKNKNNFDLVIGTVIDQIKNNNDKKMERMYIDLRKKINKIENIGDDKVNIKEAMIKDMERRLFEIETYKKKVEKSERKKKDRLMKNELKKEKKKKKYDNKKNWILKKHNLISDDVEVEEPKKMSKKISLTKEIKQEDLENVHPYVVLYNKLKSRIPNKWLSVFNDKEITNYHKELASKYEKDRNGAFKKMKLQQNKLRNKYSMKKAYGSSRGVIILDNREGDRVKIYKKYGCQIKERFLNRAKIFMQYMHNFNFCFKNEENGDVLNIYYDDTVKPYMIYVEYKSKNRGTILYKYKKRMIIGEKIEIKINTYEDSKGEHFRVRFLKFDKEFDKMVRIMNINSNVYFEIYVEEFEDDTLFDI